MSTEARIRILMAGPGVTLQDGGRHGYLRFGVTPAGPMDRLAFETANRALGNPPGATAIEVGLGGLEFTVEAASLTIAIAGGDFAITLDGRRLPPALLLRLDIGAVVKIAAGAAGAWCYVALAGDLLVAPMLGSTATHTRSGFGGIEGRPLAKGDALRIAEPRLPAAASGILAAPWLARPNDVIRVILGPQDDYFDADQVAAFLAGPWRLSARGDRMAYFLDGPRLRHAEGFNIVSDGVAMGAIQVPGEGQPIVLMADRQPTGGYPKIATVIGPDLGRLAQARPGSTLRFQAVTIDEAVAARRAERAALEAEIALTPLRRTAFSPGFLLGLNLTDVGADSQPPGRLTARQRLAVLFDDALFEEAAGPRPSALVRAEGHVEGRRAYAAAPEGALTAEDIGTLAGLLGDAARAHAPAVLILDGMAMAAGDAAALYAAFRPAAAPRIAVVLGPCLGPDAILAALADITILSTDRGVLASGGPSLVQALTGEILTDAEIGGPATHAASGALVDCEPHEVAALCRARRLLGFMPDQGPDLPVCADNAAREEPGLDSLVPSSRTEVYDIRHLLAAIADDGDFLEIAPDGAPNLVIGLARFGGWPTGILANQPKVLAGVLDVAALTKAARFVDRCAALSLPLLTVVDCPGLLPGPDQERAGLLPHAATLIRALAAYTAPRATVVTRHAAGPVAALMGIGQGPVCRWPSAPGLFDPLFGPVIAPRATRRWVLGALA
jgi:biotin-dependent carboxylase-like uncharacterized protein